MERRSKDLNKKNSQIENNCLNLFPMKQYGLRLGNSSKLDCSRLAPYLSQRISYQDGSRVLYTYDAGGVKLRTDYYINPLASSVPQVAGATGSAGTTLKHTWTDYCGNLIYENDTITQVHFPGGYVTYRDTVDNMDMIDSLTTYTANVPVYHYYIQDHLGNNRIVVDEDEVYGSSIEQINHYYPFGGLMGESRNLTSNQKYKYNGKELDRMHGLDWYDYGARMYDAALGQWHVVDPLAEKYLDSSPYSYCVNNPVANIDFNGKDWITARYENTLWVYDDSEIKSQEDIIKKYYGGNQPEECDIHYVGEKGVVYNIKDGVKTVAFTLNKDGSFTNSAGESSTKDTYISDKFGDLNIGNSKNLSSKHPENSNWYGSYLGPNNPQKNVDPKDDSAGGRDTYVVPPRDFLDYAAYKHDRSYDEYHAAGAVGVISNFNVAEADRQLSVDAYNDFKSTQDTQRKVLGICTSFLFSIISDLKISMRLIKYKPN